MKTLLNFLIGYLAIAILISILSGDIATGFSFTIIIGIYMLPPWLALSRGHPNQGSISTLNLF